MKFWYFVHNEDSGELVRIYRLNQRSLPSLHTQSLDVGEDLRTNNIYRPLAFHKQTNGNSLFDLSIYNINNMHYSYMYFSLKPGL